MEIFNKPIKNVSKLINMEKIKERESKIYNI